MSSGWEGPTRFLRRKEAVDELEELDIELGGLSNAALTFLFPPEGLLLCLYQQC